MNLIGISGKTQSGKDLLGQLINLKLTFGVLNQRLVDAIATKDLLFDTVKYADKLKDVICVLLGCTRLQLEDDNYKNKILPSHWWYFKTKNNILLNYNDDKTLTGLELIKLTPRRMLQLFGTECGRQIIHPNIWINATFENYNPYSARGSDYKSTESKWIITDVRFPNEAEAILDRGGTLIRINRSIQQRFPELWDKVLVNSKNRFDSEGMFLTELYKQDKLLWKKLTHESETALDDYDKFSNIIDNNLDLENLYDNVNQLF